MTETAAAPTAPEPEEQRPRVGIALSGGGHRASLWALGALFAAVDSGMNEDTVSIASVSGGSIANGILAAADVPFPEATRQTLENDFAAAIRAWARDGLFFSGPPTDGYVAGLFFAFGALAATIVGSVATVVALSRSWSDATVAFAAAVLFVGTVGVVSVAGRKLRGHFLLPLVAGASLLIVTSAGGMAAAVAADGPGEVIGVLAGVAVIVAAMGWLTARHFGRRADKVERGLHESLLKRKKLEDVDSAVHHVFCATDLSTADHAYFSPRVVYGHGLGIAEPAATVDLATVVQASACLPGAFPPRRLRPDQVAVKAVGMDSHPIALTDGGVYDNMADQWEFGYANRAANFAKHHRRLVDVQAQPAEQLIVVNASRGFTRSPIARKGLLGEVSALLRCKDVLYDVSTAVRRRYLFDMFELAEHSESGLTGVLVHIGQLPSRVPERVLEDSPDPKRRGRAAEASKLLKRLGKLDPGVDWPDLVDRNASVPTTLGSIGVDVAAGLLHHAYVLTRINAFVLLGRGELPTEEDDRDEDVMMTWRLDRFARLVAGATAEKEP